jgi:hypothetical protein
MKGRRDGQQNLAGEEKEKPDQRDRKHALDPADNALKTAPGRGRRRGQLREAGRAENAAVVLGHAFPAEKPLAARAAGGRLAVRVVEATTLDKGRHDAEFASA